ncbi:MAG: hypothetical protein LC623_01675 [Halobacteriales archaeon]|nr:hypothetical protein [Halobacteriales archaeon]
MECECPVCHRGFKTPQGRGGHLLHAPDLAHQLYRQQQQLAAVLAAKRTAAQAQAPPAPASAAPVALAQAAPAAVAASVVQPVPVAWPSLTRGLQPGAAAWSEAAAPQAAPQASPAQAPPAPTAPVRASDFLKPAGAALMGGAVGAAVAGASHRGVGFLFGAGAGVLVWWAIEQRRHAPPAPKAEPVVEVPPEWRGIFVPGAGWSL